MEDKANIDAHTTEYILNEVKLDKQPIYCKYFTKAVVVICSSVTVKLIQALLKPQQK